MFLCLHNLFFFNLRFKILKIQYRKTSIMLPLLFGLTFPIDISSCTLYPFQPCLQKLMNKWKLFLINFKPAKDRIVNATIPRYINKEGGGGKTARSTRTRFLPVAMPVSSAKIKLGESNELEGENLEIVDRANRVRREDDVRLKMMHKLQENFFFFFFTKAVAKKNSSPKTISTTNK